MLAPPLLSLTADKGVTRVQVPGGYVFAFQLTININFMKPARRPQSRKGRLAAAALRQRRDGVKEDYYV